MSAYKTTEPLNGVECNVESCTFNQDGTKCIASSICVKPLNSLMHLHETDCATYTKKD